jgi:peptidoglycan/xylan/chitin deacetylase (PgdA/CDA1 family)
MTQGPRLALFSAVAAGFLFGQTPKPPAWKLSEPEIRRITDRVRAGRDLTPPSWPGGAKLAVGLSFDFDNETIVLRDGGDSVSQLSQGEFGARRGVHRVLALLKQHQIKATFFIPAVSAILHQGAVKDIASSGHEIGIHGWIHERNSQLDQATERDLMLRAAMTLEQISGKKPVGLRTPSWDYSPHTIGIAKQMGLLYDSSLMADDHPYEVNWNGQPTGVIELPVEWILDDAPYFTMDRFTTVRPTMNQEQVIDMWKAEFDQAFLEGGLYILTMHPHVIGHRGRIHALNRLVEHMKKHKGVWFATHEDIARWVKQKAGL